MKDSIPHRDRDPERVPDLLLEKLALGELEGDVARAVEARLAAEPGGRERLVALRADDAAILAAYPADRLATAIEGRARIAAAARASAPRRRPWLWPALSVAVATALVLLVLRPGGGPDSSTGSLFPLDGPDAPDAIGTTRAKGPTGARLAVFLRRDDQAERLPPGSAVAPHDRLQLGYVAADAAFGVLVSIDGRGQVTLHFPESAGADTALSHDGEVVLPYAYELDDAPGFERFLLVTANHPLAPTAVAGAARRLASAPDGGRSGDLALPDTAHQTSIILNKVVPQ